MADEDQLREIDGRRPPSERPIWIVSDGTGCDHGQDPFSYVGSDGRNEYYQCERCDAVIVAAPP